MSHKPRCVTCKYLKQDKDKNMINFYCSHPKGSSTTTYMSEIDTETFGCVFHYKGKSKQFRTVEGYINSLKSVQDINSLFHHVSSVYPSARLAKDKGTGCLLISIGSQFFDFKGVVVPEKGVQYLNGLDKDA